MLKDIDERCYLLMSLASSWQGSAPALCSTANLLAATKVHGFAAGVRAFTERSRPGSIYYIPDVIVVFHLADPTELG